MAETNQLNYGWLVNMPNANHDGTTQQVDDILQAYQSDNEVFNQKKAAVHTARQREDDVWLTSQRDPNVKRLEAADQGQDGYIAAGRYILLANAGLPDSEPTKAEAVECLQVFTDYNFRTDNNYGAESDKIIQMKQNFQSHEAYLTQIGAWQWILKAVEQAQLVRHYLNERAKTMGEAVKGEMKAARTATDQAIANIYKVINAMMELMPSPELTALFNQLKGIELYAKQYYLGGKGGASAGTGTSTGSGTGAGTNTGAADAGANGGSEGGSSSEGGSGDTGGTGGSGDTGGDNTGGSGSDTGGTGDSGGGGLDHGGDEES